MIIKFLTKPDQSNGLKIKFGDESKKITGIIKSNGYGQYDIIINLFDIDHTLLYVEHITYGELEYSFKVDSGEYYMLIDNGYSIDLIDGIIV